MCARRMAGTLAALGASRPAYRVENWFAGASEAKSSSRCCFSPVPRSFRSVTSRKVGSDQVHCFVQHEHAPWSLEYLRRIRHPHVTSQGQLFNACIYND